MRHAFLCIGLFLVALLSFGPVQAELTFCNKTDVQHSFAVGYKSGSKYKSVGWWNIDPGKCTIVVGGNLRQRFYYYRAEASGRETPDADYTFCTAQVAFDISGDENCEARGYDNKRFRKLDVGQGRTGFTMNLIPPDGSEQGLGKKTRSGLFGIKD